VPDAVDARLAELAERWNLPATGPRQLRAVLEAVAAEPTSITTVRDAAQGVDVHVADALSGLEAAELRGAAAIADLGAGGGFPGLVLAIALPDAGVTLVESVRKKCDFLRRTAQSVGLGNVAIVEGRAEEWRTGLGTQDAVTARALAPLNVLAEYAAPLLKPGGALVAYKGRRDPCEEAAGMAAASLLGLEVREPLRVTPFPAAEERHLHLYLKVGPTPARFPRRAGMPRKRPLGA
jgi:16S rRNA (guanine527-N7)-methyltransferase